MKKILAILLAMMLVLSMGFAAFAEDPETPAPTTAPTYTDQSTVTIKKVYNLAGAGSSPADTFKLQLVSKEVTDGEAKTAPDLTITDVSFGPGAAGSANKEGSFTINLPTYTNVGVYTYILEEVARDIAGITYHVSQIKLVVTVINGEDGNIRIAAVHTETGSNGTKSNTITNTYSANSLTVNKTVEGNLGDKKDTAFKFTADFKGPQGKEVKSTVTYGNNQTLTFTDEDIDGVWTATATFELKHGESITFENLPAGVEYDVKEDAYEGYTTDSTGAKGTISSDAASVASFVNTKNGTIDTGFTADNLPYIMLLGFVVLAGAAMLIKRRAARHN